MTNDAIIYEFAGLRFSPFGSILENLSSGKKIKLTQTQCHFLLAIITKSPDAAEYDELREKVWVQYTEMSDSLKHLIQETKRGLVKTLKREGFTFDFIEALPKKGYRLKTEVKTISGNLSAENECFTQSVDFDSVGVVSAESDEQTRKISETPKYTAYKIVTSFFYGMLFWLALMLETAYQFDRYGASAFRLGVPLIIWNGGIMFVALTTSQLEIYKRSTFWLGAFLVIISAVSSCLAISVYLPFEPVTAARFQSQPAFAAFLKNVLLYFLPLGVFYIYAPFFLFRRARQKLQNVLPNLFGFLFLALVYSLFSTFYLLDNLLPGQFHNLFVTLVFLRFIVYFGLALACLIWMKAHFD